MANESEAFEAERRGLFQARPIIVGRVDAVREPGAFFTHDDAGVPLLVTRDHGDRVHVMSNVCRHRGMRLVDAPCGSANAFVCPHHAWTYDPCGHLGTMPLSRCRPGVERAESALVELWSEVRHGFVWAVPRPTRIGVSIAELLGAFDDELSARKLADHVVLGRSERVRACNWRLVLGALREGADVVESGPHWRAIVERPAATVYGLSPNGLLVFQSDAVSHVAVYPRAIDETLLVHTMLAPRAPSAPQEEEAWRGAWREVDRMLGLERA